VFLFNAKHTKKTVLNPMMLIHKQIIVDNYNNNSNSWIISTLTKTTHKLDGGVNHLEKY
jgi:hypothetical protein